MVRSEGLYLRNDWRALGSEVCGCKTVGERCEASGGAWDAKVCGLEAVGGPPEAAGGAWKAVGGWVVGVCGAYFLLKTHF